MPIRYESGGIMRGFEPDMVMHLAAECHVDRLFIDSPSELVHTNVVVNLHTAAGEPRLLEPPARQVP